MIIIVHGSSSIVLFSRSVAVHSCGKIRYRSQRKVSVNTDKEGKQMRAEEE